MVAQQSHFNARWAAFAARIRSEYATLSQAEKRWLAERTAAIGRLQAALDDLFCKAGGSSACADCHGECCGCGRHHVTLTNLLAFLVVDELPPEPDFSKTCPYLGDAGCSLPVTRRPYNCITFFCDQLEDSLCPEDRAQLRQLDKQLRAEYEAVAGRYPVASLRGLWIAMEQLGKGRILRSNKPDMVK